MRALGADNRNYLEFDSLIARIFFALFVPFAAIPYLDYFLGLNPRAQPLSPFGTSLESCLTATAS
jgi:hypothetical protein